MSEGLRPGPRLAPFLSASLALHGAAALVVALDPSRWPLVLATLVLDHSLAVGASLAPRSRLLGPNLSRLPDPDGEVALTFDDGPDTEVTPALLDLLERHGARATFFCVGDTVERHPALAAEIVARGHRVGNHTHTHPPGFWFLPPAALARQLDRAQAAVARATGARPTLFRAPAGIRPPWVEPFLSRRGLRLVSWSRRGLDTLDRDPGRVAARLLRGLAPGDILLLHDGGSARDGAGRPVVLGAAERLLDGLGARGLRSVAIPPGRQPG